MDTQTGLTNALPNAVMAFCGRCHKNRACVEYKTHMLCFTQCWRYRRRLYD